MATLSDFVKVPRVHSKITDRAWGNFASRLTGWMNELRRCVDAIDTRLTSVRSDLDTLGVWATYDPTVTAAVVTSKAAYYTDINGTIIVHGTILLGGSGTAAAVTITLPVTAATIARGNFGWGSSITNDGGTIHHGEIKTSADGLSFTIEGASHGGVAVTYAGNALPHVPASGDLLFYRLTYPKV